MPYDMPDLESLKHYASMWRLRIPNENETECEYRAFVASTRKDPLERMEVKCGKGWDKWNDTDKAAMIIEILYPISYRS